MTDLLKMVQNKRKAIQRASGRGKKTVKIQGGKTQIRILPSWRGKGEQFWHDFSQHYVHGAPDSEGKTLRAVYVCTAATFGKQCPICEAIEDGIRNATDDDTLKLLEKASVGKNPAVLVNAWFPDTDEVEIVELRPSVFESIAGIMEDYGDITDPETGTDVIIERTGTGRDTRYHVNPAPPAKIRQVPASVLERIANIDEFVDQEADEEQRKALTAVNVAAKGLAAPAGAFTAAALTHDKGKQEFVPREEPMGMKGHNIDDDIPFDIDDAEIEDVEVESEAEKPQDVKLAEEVSDASSGDDDLDSLLADL